SKTILLPNYYTFQHPQINIQPQHHHPHLLLYHQQTHNKYPLFQHYNPTHIISPNHICLIEQLHPFFHAAIDPFNIHRILQSEQYINVLT
ncbi:U32 family peptidase, partial [Staphylococcus epidermidis]|uniref:U32 family peptidase n=1 Tax=Staphylococcus epidermidis TaxID=1282 RepID=UPI001C92E4C4